MGPALASLVTDGLVSLAYHPMNFLDEASTTNYSTRAAAASAIGLVILLAVEPVRNFLQFTTVVTVAGVAAGTLLSVLWFIQMLRRCGLRIRFGQA